MNSIIESLRNGLIVSCQASPGTPLDSPQIMAALARSAELGGAVGIRANHGPNISAVTEAVNLPVIGIKKRDVTGYDVYITPELVDVEEARNAGARIIALDATARPRPGPHNFGDLVKHIHERAGLLVMADVSTFDEGVTAARAGADLIATTMSGHTPYTADRRTRGPDYELVTALSDALNPPAARMRGTGVPVICEGRIHTPHEAMLALEAGAYAVVVGTAITAPGWIAEQFAAALHRVHKSPAPGD